MKKGIAIAVLAVIPSAATANGFGDLLLSVKHDENVTRGYMDRDIYSDISAHLALSAGKFLQLQPGRAIVLSGNVSGTRYRDLDGFNNSTAGLSAAYQHKAGLGAYAPVYAFTLSGWQQDSPGRARDHGVLEANASFRKRLSAAWNIHGGLLYEISEGDHDGDSSKGARARSNDIYDYRQRAVYAGVNYQFANQSLLAFDYSFTDGYTVASAVAPDFYLLDIARASVRDPAIVPAGGGVHAAYSLKTETHMLTLDWSIPLGRDTSLSSAISWQDITGPSSVKYNNEQFQLRLLHAF